MFKTAICLLITLAIPAFALDKDGSSEEDPVVLGSPAQYFAMEFSDPYYSYCPNYWTILFPDNPPFAYACMYLPSFDREFGFYLDGDDLCWARSVGPVSAQMLSQAPVIDLQSQGADGVFRLLTHLLFPVCGNLMEYWDRLPRGNEDNPFSESRGKGSFGELPRFRDRRLLMACWMESVINPILYRRLYVRRGRVALNPALAEALRKTWDEAVTRRTFEMDMYRQVLTRCDGNYFYFRGNSGPSAEDLCDGEGKMRLAMRDLAFGLMDMAMMDDWNPETEKWLMEQCSRIRQYAAATGDDPPPMVSEAWVDDFLKRLWKQLDEELARRKEREKKASSPQGGAVVKEQEEPEEVPSSPYVAEKYIWGFRARFLNPLDRNPLWKDLFPKGTRGKVGVCWLGSRGISGFYLDGPLMGRAEAPEHTPLSVYDNWFVNRTPERKLFPYEGIADAEGYVDPRVKREWVTVGEDVSRLMGEMLTAIAKREMAAGKEEKENDGNGILFCIIRGTDGMERIMDASDADLREVVELMELLYTVDLLFLADDNYLQYVFKKRAVLQGRTAEEEMEGSQKSGIWSSSGGRYLWGPF